MEGSGSGVGNWNEGEGSESESGIEDGNEEEESGNVIVVGDRKRREVGISIWTSPSLSS